MLSYDAASNIIDRYLPFITYNTWGGESFSVLDLKNTYTDRLIFEAYDILSEMYIRNHACFSPCLDTYIEQYIQACVPPRDALILMFSVFGREDGSFRHSWMVNDDAFQAGLAEMLDAYLAGVPLEHILG